MKYFTFLLLSCLLLSSCEDEIPELIVDCQNGFIEEDNACICPEGNVTAYDNCVELNENQYYGITDGCPCNDTLIWTLYEENNENGLITRETRINENLSLIALGSIEPSRLKPIHLLYVVPTSVGDSLFLAAGPDIQNGFLMRCDASQPDDDFNESVLFNGLLSPDEKTISATFTYMDNSEPSNVVGTCTVNFEKEL